jgi:valine--pyruvate aminotransferase
LTLSLSKIGLPGTRTGIVVANEEVVRAISSMTSIVGLANCNVGQTIVEPLMESGEILRLSREVVRPYYEQKSIQTQQIVREVFDDRLPYRIHRSEGAFFLWLWFEGLPISSKELYRRLKERSVFVIPGNYFFFGDDMRSGDSGSGDNGSGDSGSEWQHRNECIRVSFTMPEPIVRRGFEVIAEEVAKAYS